jgi:transglutaminase-like putative cysteine protease
MRATGTHRQGSRRRGFVTASLLLAAPILCIPLSARAADYTYETFHDEYVVDADGSYVETMEVRETPLTRSAVEDMGQVDLSYSQNLAELDVLEAYVMKRDGRRIDVPKDAMKLQDDAASDGAPMFTDEKHRIIIFPQLEPEDSIVYKVRIRQHVAYFPGHFLESWNFPSNVDVADARIDISVPKGHPLFVDAEGFVSEQVKQGDADRIHYRWTYRKAQAPDYNTRFAVSSFDFGARLHVSTMKDYRVLAAAFEARAADKAVPTDEIRQLADSLTKGVTDRREMARRLYDWVNLNIRYVATYVGAGGYVPHAAGEVLHNRYGDCKDHVVMLEALLAAKGIASSAAILNSGSSYLLPEVPSRTPFNHAITYLPEFDLFVDSTDHLAPFGVLGDRVADKPAIVTRRDDPLMRTPALTAEGNGIEVTSDATLHPDGSVDGKSRAVLRGAHSGWIRSTLADASDSQMNEWSGGWLHDVGLEGSSSLGADDPYTLDDSFAVAGKFTTKSLLDLTQPGAFYIPESYLMSYTLKQLADDTLEASTDVNVICGAFSAMEKTTITLPRNIEVLNLPAGADVSKGRIEYQSSYSMMDGKIAVTRRFADRSVHGQCTPAETRDQMEVAHAMQRDLQKLILFRPSPNL